MHLVTNSAPVNLGKTLGILEPGNWLCHDANAFEIAMIAERGKAKLSYEGWRHFLATEDGPDDTRVPSRDRPTLIMRSGTIGDLLMLTPALKEYKLRTRLPIALSCFSHHVNQFDHTGLVDQFLPYPFPLARAGEFSRILDLGNTIESNHERLAHEVFAQEFELPIPLPSYKPLYVVSEFEKEAAKKHVFTNRPNLAVQPVASVPNRNYPPQKMLQTIFELEKRGWGVLILGRKGQVPMLPPQLQTPYVRNLSVHDLPLRESVAVLANCQAFLGVDSAFMHFAAALDIPAVSLHGPFPWGIRTAGYPKNIAVSGKGDCAGCCWHLHAGSAFPPNKPCSDNGICVVMSSIEPGRIIAKVDALRP